MNHMSNLRIGSVAATVLLFCCVAFAQGVSTNAPAPNPNLTAPGPQRQQPAGGQRQPATNLGIANAPTPSPVHMVGQGAIVGYVYWDTKSVTHTPTANCSGLGAAVGIGTPSKGQPTFEQFTLLGTFHNFTYIGNAGSYAICQYTVKQVPLGQDLQVMVNFKQPSFTPAIVAAVPATANNPNHPINISGGSCNKLPPSVPSASVLGSGWWTCGNNAYNVNFVLQPATAANMGSGGGQITLLPGNLQGATSPGSKSGMLAGGSASRGMLSGGNNLPASGVQVSSQPSPGNHGTLLGNRQPPAVQSGGPQTPGSNVALNPQPLPPVPAQNLGAVSSSSHMPTSGGRGKSQPSSLLKPIKLPAPRSLKKMTNPRLAQQNAAIIAVLDQQRQAAQQESAAMNSAGTTARSAAPARASALKANLQGRGVQGIGPLTIQSSTKIPTSMPHPAALNGLVIQCAKDPTPRIMRVSGGSAPAVFTPEAKYNLYTIAGCSFGPSTQGNSAYIFGSNGFKANLNIDFWSDNGITAHLDPSLAGVLDQGNITLVVAPANQQPFQKSGFTFYAARGMPGPAGSDQEVPLAYNSMPQSSVSLFDSTPVMTGYDQVPPNGTSQFPSFSFQGNPVAGWVFRYAYGHQDGPIVSDCYINDVHYDDGTNKMGPCLTYLDGWPPSWGTDTWDFSKLVPGFGISSYNLYYEGTDASTLCGAWDDEDKQSGTGGNWNFGMASPSQITVGLTAYYCHDLEFSARVNQQYQSAYGLAVWVLGPRCVDPWTGQKDQSCLAKVKQILG